MMCISPEKRQVLDLFTQGRKMYIERKFGEALVMFRKALLIDPHDGPSRVYYRRCAAFQKNPPPPEWNGVFTFKTK